jgi:hypothetical protein
MADNMMENGSMKKEDGQCGCGKSSCASCSKGGSCSSGSGRCGKGCCGCMHHKLPMIMVLLVGVVFLAKAYGWVSASVVDIAWPIFVIVGALTKLMGSKCKCC